nr:sensor histidine kinase [uncultured Dorea sp.]
MKDWTRKRKIDFIIGVALQIYLLFPWVQHYTIYGYLFNTLKINDYVQMYNKTLLPSLKEEAWNYTKIEAFIFLIIIILLMLFQLIELMRIYYITTNERKSDYRGFFWIIYLIFFWIFIDNVEFVDYSLIPAYVEVYMIVLLVFLGLWILIDAMLDTWEAEHQILISQLEEQEKHALQTKVKILEERYQEMLKSRKVVHDMKNHILALKKYDQEQNWSGLHEYLNELSDDMLEYNFHVWTGNHMLDMILNQKRKDAQNQNTVIQIDTEVFSTLPFTDREIISLFGNLLDNALEACEKINDKERWIKIKIKKKNLLLYIEIANALEQMPKQIQKEFVSNKKDNGLHGYGIKNIQDIVKKYDGLFQYKVYEDHLIFMISIYNN